MAAAELKLQVGLDLAFFRQQLAQLGNVAVGYHMPINIKFSPIVIQQELSRLKKNIGKTQYTVNIKTNLESEIKNADRLVKALQRVQRESGSGRSGLPVDIRQLRKTKSQGGFSAADIKTLFNAAIEGGLLDEKTLGKTREQMVTAFAGIGKDSIEGLLNGLSSAEASIRAAAESIGATLITTTKASLGIRSPSKKFEEIGRNVGKGFENGVLSSMDTAFNALERKMQQRMAVLDTIARGVFHMLGMDPAAMVAAQKQKLLPPAINWQSSVATPPQYRSKPGTMLTGAPSPTLIGGTPGSFGLLPAAYRGIGPGRNAGALPPAYRGIGPSAKPAGLLPSLSSAGQSNAIIEALIASTGPRRLPSGGGDNSLGKLAAPRQTKDAVDAILRNYFKVVEVQVKEVFSAPPVKKESLNIFDYLDMGQYFNYLAQARINTENAIKRSIEEAKQVTKQNRIKDAAQSFIRALEDVVRNAERSAFAQSRIAATRSYIQRANIREIGQPLLEGRQVAPPKMLSAATGFYRGAATPPPLPETQAQLFARRESEARVRSALRSVDVMGSGAGRTAASYSYAYRAARPTSAMVPYGPGGALATTNQPPTPPTPPGGGRGGRGGGMGAFPNISLPGAGLVSELGGEFAMAAKQVLLFGTAYKALAFLTDFPSKVGEAVGQLQTFRNTLQAITPNANEFQQSNQFILDTVAKYNTPLQSARDGFTNLYASMAPAGFKGDEIRNIFSGISQGAATFSMSADKVDRVNYAFAQMASKGQVMSEELKGQLGDVLPGAVAIFAKAAGFTGPNAMVDFTKAMEAGRYKGEAMKQLLINVGIVMKDKFAKGAEGAAQNFQGQMNAMANATKKLYEAFEPAGNLFSSKVIAPFTKGLIVITDGFNAFFTGVAAKTAGGFALSQELERLKPTFEGLRANIAGLIPSFQIFGSVLLNVAKTLAIVAGNPITGFLLKVYANVLLVNTAFTLLGGRILVGLITNIGLAASRLFAMNAAFFALQRTSAVTNSTLAGTQLQMMLLQRNATGVVGPVNALLGSLLRMAAIGAIAIAITIAITNANELRDAELRLARLRGERDPVGPDGPKPVMTPARRFTGASRETVQSAKAAQAPLVIQYRKELKVLQQQLLTARAIAASSEDNAQASVANTQARTAQARVDAKLLDIQNAQGILNLNPSSFKTAKEQQAASLELAPIPGATGATGGKGSGADDAKRIAEQIKQQLKSAQDLKFEQQNRLTLLRAENDFTKAFTGFSIQRLEIERRYSELLEKSQSKEETAALQESRAAEYKQSRLTLQQRINELLKQDQAPLDDAVESIKNQAAFEREYGELIKNGTNPELAKQLIAIRKAYDESVKLLEPALAAAQAAVTKATAEGASATEIQKYREELERIEAIRKGLAGKKAEGEAAAQEVWKGSTPMFGDKLKTGLAAAREELAKLTDVENMLVGAANSIGEAFSSSFKGIIDGSMTAQQALAGFFQNLSNYFADMVAKMIAEWLKMQLIEGLLGLVSMFAPGFGSGIAPGPVAKSAGVKYSATKMGPGFANGGIAYGGFQAFASGGIVTGPTMGLVGEGKYNEAVIPLPDGKSVPVDLGGMSGGAGSPVNVVVNVDAKGSTVEGDESKANDLGRAISVAVQSELIKQQRPGGLLASTRR